MCKSQQRSSMTTLTSPIPEMDPWSPEITKRSSFPYKWRASSQARNTRWWFSLLVTGKSVANTRFWSTVKTSMARRARTKTTTRLTITPIANLSQSGWSCLTQLSTTCQWMWPTIRSRIRMVSLSCSVLPRKILSRMLTNGSRRSMMRTRMKMFPKYSLGLSSMPPRILTDSVTRRQERNLQMTVAWNTSQSMPQEKPGQELSKCSMKFSIKRTTLVWGTKSMVIQWMATN